MIYKILIGLIIGLIGLFVVFVLEESLHVGYAYLIGWGFGLITHIIIETGDKNEVI